ncbi:MAG: hypothetical protein ABSB84_06210 [Verrucomicrobiota bacterium]
MEVASSSDGSKLVAITLNIPNTGQGFIYTSTNSGVTWISNNVPNNELWYAINSSSDGNKLVAAVYGYNSGPNTIFSSANSGFAWETNDAPNNYWRSIASSADGSKIVAVTQGGGIYTSQTDQSPQLNIAPASTSLTLSWIIPSTNFMLQQSSDLTTTNWTTLTNVPTLNLSNLQNQVILCPSNGSGFYRLKTP